MGISFDAPPLTEVSVGRTFSPRPDFLIPHFGKFWKQLAEEFPKVEHATPIVTPSEATSTEFLEGLILPRVWFVTADSTRLLQLQQNRFHYNWRQTPEISHYIRFPAIQSKALELWEAFSQFIESETGQPLVALTNELTYTNHILGEAQEGPFDVALRCLRDVMWTEGPRGLPAPTQLTQSYIFAGPEDLGKLTVAVANGRRISDNLNLVKLDLTVQGKALKDVGFAEWSQRAHDFLVGAFKDLTRPAMHTKWLLQETANE